MVKVKKGDLLSKTCDYLKEKGLRKPVHVPKQQFTITDDEGHSRNFTVKRQDKEALYTMDDVRKILDAMVDIVIDTVKHGEPVYIQKIGTLNIRYREARKVRIPGTRQWKDVPGHYVPKLEYAQTLKDAARIYESYVVERGDPLTVPKPKRGRGRPRKNQEGTVVYRDVSEEHELDDTQDFEVCGDESDKMEYGDDV